MTRLFILAGLAVNLHLCWTETALPQQSVQDRPSSIYSNSAILPIRGLYVQFERRGWPAEYWPGTVIQTFNDFDAVVNRTVSAEVSAQLDAIKQMGVNTITYEFRSTDANGVPGDPQYPTCRTTPPLGLNWPQPTATELANLVPFFDLVQSKGMKILLRLVNTHMEEQPPTNATTWLGAILQRIKDHPALELVLFEGDARVNDSNGDGTPDACGVPAEPPLWLGPRSVPAVYIKWAIGYAMSLGMPARKLSAEAVVGDFFVESQPPAGPDATDNHLWSPIAVLKGILDSLNIPNNQRTYAISFYEHRKCVNPRGLPCTDVDPHTWGGQTLAKVYSTIGTGNGARVIAAEMGVSRPIDASWSPSQAVQSLVALMIQYGVDGGCYWHWVSGDNNEDADPTLGDAVKKRGVNFTYNPVKDMLTQWYTNPTSVGPTPSVPTTFSLDQNFPNPFNPSTTIRYGIPNQSHVLLEIYNLLGQRVATLVDDEQLPAYYQTSWNVVSVSSGLYFYRLQAGSFVETKKLLLLK